MAYLAVTSGVTVDAADQRAELAPGDLVLAARGDGHRLFGEGATEWIRGDFDVDASVADPILSVPPALIHCTATDPGSRWLPLSMDLLLDEALHPRPGGEVMACRILDLLFIHALRQWSASGPGLTPGWLTAAMDPHIGMALAEVHADPHRAWTVAELGRTALLSRSSFAARFTSLMGVTPATYLTGRRMEWAKDLLRDTTLAVGDIGHTVGYASESSFSRAFSRCCGVSPRGWRQSRLESERL